MSFENNKIERGREALGVLVVVEDEKSGLELLENWSRDITADQIVETVRLLNGASKRLSEPTS